MNWISDRMSNGQPNTVRETFLQLELNRIRSTYSFRLGLLLTDSIFRKPWMALFLPLTFLKMNYEYFLDRRSSKLDEKDSAIRAGSNCLMLITASEEGVSASERTISIAKSWLNQKEHKVVVVSTNENLTSMTIQGVSHYQIPDPKTHRDISTSEWNDTCANVVRGAIETHIPHAVVFDGTYPYRGILNALTISSHQKKIWLRPDTIDSEVVERAKGIFDVIITQDITPIATISGGGAICNDGTTTNIDFNFNGLLPWDLTYSNGNISATINNINTALGFLRITF